MNFRSALTKKIEEQYLLNETFLLKTINVLIQTSPKDMLTISTEFYFKMLFQKLDVFRKVILGETNDNTLLGIALENCKKAVKTYSGDKDKLTELFFILQMQFALSTGAKEDQLDNEPQLLQSTTKQLGVNEEKPSVSFLNITQRLNGR